MRPIARGFPSLLIAVFLPCIWAFLGNCCPVDCHFQKPQTVWRQLLYRPLLPSPAVPLPTWELAMLWVSQKNHTTWQLSFHFKSPYPTITWSWAQKCCLPVECHCSAPHYNLAISTFFLPLWNATSIYSKAKSCCVRFELGPSQGSPDFYKKGGIFKNNTFSGREKADTSYISFLALRLK